MSEERSISSNSLIDLHQSHYSLNLDQMNLNDLNVSNESNSESNVQTNQANDVSLINLQTDNQTVYFHPSFLQLNTSPQLNQQAAAANLSDSIELNIINQTSQLAKLKSKNFKATTSNQKSSFEWDMYNDRNKVLKELRKNKKFIDVQLIAEDGYYEYAHSTVISALGKGLANFIFNLKQDPKTPCTILEVDDNFKNHIKQIHLNGISGSVLKVIVNCAYTGYIQTDDKQVVWSILNVAERFAMNDVLKGVLYLFNLST